MKHLLLSLTFVYFLSFPLSAQWDQNNFDTTRPKTLGYDKAASVKTSINYFPLRKGCKQQFLRQSNGAGVYNYRLEQIDIVKDTLIENKIYVLYNNKWLRYSEDENIIWIWYKDTNKVYMDFSLPPDSTFPYYYDVLTVFMATIFEGTETLFGNAVIYKGYSWGSVWSPDGYCTESFGENIGPISRSSTILAGPDSYSTSTLIMEIMYDSSGNEIQLTDHHKPEFNLVPITQINSGMFQLDFSVDHFYSTFFDPATPYVGTNFVKEVLFISNYSKNGANVKTDTISANNVQSTNQYTISIPVDTILLKDGYSFNYQLVAKDKGLIPEISFSPESGFYQCIGNFSEEIENKEEELNNYYLYQNYPNPFNPSTNIKYTISSKQFVSLKVYDVLGEEIITLVSEEKPAGNYEIEFNASNYAGGIYYYQLQTSDFIDTKKMILLK